MPLIRDRLKRRKQVRPEESELFAALMRPMMLELERLHDLAAQVSPFRASMFVDVPIDAGWWWPSADYKRVPVSPFEAACQERAAARRRLLH